MKRTHQFSSGCGVVTAVLILLASVPARAHETDQFTLPPGREFADVGPLITRWFYRAISTGVERTNAEIRDAMKSHHDQGSLKELQSDDHLVHAVNHSMPWALDVIDGWDNDLVTAQMQAAYPGFVTAYKQPITNIYQHTHSIIDPRQFFRIWLSRTLVAYGHNIGTDKIGHFTDMGMNYYKAYHKARMEGANEKEAYAKALWLGTDDFWLSEKGMLGYLTAGDYANGDLAANFLGYVFYRNLTEPMMLKGQTQPPMVEHDGPYWKLASYVRPDSDFMAAFICDHMDEGLNPGHFESGMRPHLRTAVKERREVILEHYRDEHGCRRPRIWFDRKMEELTTYYGVNYGVYGPYNERVSIGATLFEPLHEDRDVNSRNEYGETPLHVAAAAEDPAAVQRLLARGADPNAPLRSSERRNSDWGNTPLHYAAASGNVQCVQLLLAAGANPNARNDLDVTPLHRAARSPEIAAILIDRGAQIDSADARGRTPLHWAACDAENCQAVATLLLDKRANVDAKDHDQRTPLHLAADHGCDAVAAVLIKRGADINAPDSFRETPLHLAAARKQSPVVDVLVAGGAKIGVTDDFGCTPLHAAALADNARAVAALLRAGASPMIRDAYGITPVQLAHEHDFPSVIALLPSPETAARTASYRTAPTR